MEFENERKELLSILDFPEGRKEAILDSLVDSDIYYDSIDVSEDVYTDTEIDSWSSRICCLDGTKKLLHNIIHKPINNVETLSQRQACYEQEDCDLSVLKEYERDVLWVYTMNDEIKKNSIIHVLFPSTFLISYINHIECVLRFYHMYKIYFNPLSTLIYPIMSLFAPLYYLRRYLNINMSFSMYASILSKLFRTVFSYTNNVKQFLIKIVSVAFYIFLFSYNIYQTFEYSYMLHGVRQQLFDRIRNFNAFVKEAFDIFQRLPEDIAVPWIKNCDVKPLRLSDSMSSVYKLWKNKELKACISGILLKVYTIDAIFSVARMKRHYRWCDVTYTDSTRLWHMKNPLLHVKQVGNPVDLSRNIILTGPNAAGKTTYAKTMLFNIILSQSVGVAYAIRAEVCAYDNISSFMRIKDVLGSKSYFEAEAEYCLAMMNRAKLLCDSNKRGLFIMDEPMHSTPPTEGMATAYAVIEYIGMLTGITIIVTTHFYRLTSLEQAYDGMYVNVSVEAIKEEVGYRFPYTIKRGPSNQCIAIELLDSKDFPKSVIESAVIMKNKICEDKSR